jgi:hypothetical protein
MIGNSNSNGQPLKVLWGARAIGAHVGLSPRKAFYLLEKGLLPGEKIGKIWTSTEDRLADRIRGGRRLEPEASA